MKAHFDKHSDQVAILKTLKEVIKARGFTYAHVAKSLEVSEVTIKRILSAGQGATLERIIDICQVVGISFLDVAALAKKEDEVDYYLTAAQETYFAQHVSHFAIFKALYARKSNQEIMRTWKVGTAAFFKILRSLEKLELIDILPDERVKFRITGNIRITHRGPLAKKILRPQISLFLDHIDKVIEHKDVCMHSAEVELSPAHIKEFVSEIHTLGARYRARAFKDKSLLPAKNLRWVRWLLCFAPYETRWETHFS
jgi:transcriptional regulator with XRE-family HTH domain